MLSILVKKGLFLGYLQRGCSILEQKVTEKEKSDLAAGTHKKTCTVFFFGGGRADTHCSSLHCCYPTVHSSAHA